MAQSDRRMVVIGAGGHAKVVIELAVALGYKVVGCTDVDATPRHIVDVPVLGDDGVLQALFAQGVTFAAVGLGENALRLRIGRKLQTMGFVTPLLVSPAAYVSTSARLGAGTIIMPGAVINADTRVGDFAIVNTLAGVDHDGIVGDGAHIGPGSALSGSVNVGDCALIGVGATVLPGVRVAHHATLGGGAVAVRNVEAGATFVGSPAAPLKQKEEN